MQAIEKGISVLNKLFHRKPKETEQTGLCDSVNTRNGYIPNAIYPQPKKNKQPERATPEESTFEDSFRNLGWNPPSEARLDMPDIPQQFTQENNNILPFPSTRWNS